LTPTVKRSETKNRLLQDREQLLKSLRDHDAGKLDHLGTREREHFVESVKTRIVELIEKIRGLDGAQTVVSHGSGKRPGQKPMPLQDETPNPAPDKDYSDKEQPFTDGEENDPEIDDE
jgi:hypothetical protein